MNKKKKKKNVLSMSVLSNINDSMLPNVCGSAEQGTDGKTCNNISQSQLRQGDLVDRENNLS